VETFYQCLQSGSCNFRAWTTEKRATEKGDSPAKRLEFTAAMSFNFALVRLGQHQLALGPGAVNSSSSLPQQNCSPKKFQKPNFGRGLAS
jgi:hypothetical protein